MNGDKQGLAEGTMERLIDKLPGVEMPVEQVTETLTHMWDAEGGADDNPMGFRASQMNVILHLGMKTTGEEAIQLFDTLIQFAQKYPCRIIILCPSKETAGEAEFEGKLFSQCYIGRHLRDLCCCEALILGYSPEQSDFLENQVSVWLESDLPIYHWLHRVPADRIARHYLGFLKRCRKVLFDGSVEDDAYDSIDWPDPDRVGDLAMARTLPLRQRLGQVISGFPPEELVDGLQILTFQTSLGMRRPAYHLMDWHRKALAQCFKRPADLDSVIFRFEPMEDDDEDCCLKISWEYGDAERYLELDYDRSRRSGNVRISLPGGTLEHPLHIDPQEPESVLGEALFFV